MRCRFNWGIYWKMPNRAPQRIRSYWSAPMRCDERPANEDGICLEEVTPA
jgi:hypothetical protein